MWHVVHLIARPIEVLFGLFCVLTAIMLYPGEEGKIQSKLEDFWVRVDDYQRLALSKHVAFMTGVSQLETHFLDRVFGPKLISERALGVSFCCSMFSVGFPGVVDYFYLRPEASGQEFFAELMFGSLIIGVAYIFVRCSTTVRRAVILFVLIGLCVQLAFFPDARYHMLAFSALLLGGFGCDVAFIAVTRWLLRWAADMNSFIRIAGTVFLNVILATVLISPYWIAMLMVHKVSSITSDAVVSTLAFIGMSNFFDVAIALLFVLLALLLLVHRLAWPLLTRTLFRMSDIGTKGRRAILTTVGLALLAAGISGKVPELLQKIIEKLGG
jgi:hypothetical protein